MKVQLRPYQDQAVNGIRYSYHTGHKAPLLVMPTGGGKTVVFSHIMESASAKGSSAYLLVHRQELLLQASRHLYGLGVAHGRVAPGHSLTRDKIQVASVQTLVKRLDKYPAPKMLVIDEGHHATAGSWRTVIERYQAEGTLVLGVTATPRRLDGNGLGVESGGVYDDMILGPSVSDLIDMGFLTRPVVYAPGHAIDLSGVAIRAGDYDKGELRKRVDKPSITGDAVEHYRKICAGVPAIAFCASVEHSQNVAEAFRGAGFRALSLDGSMSDAARKDAIDALGNGRLDVLSSCDIVSEGTDVPVVGAVILLRPTASESLFLQQVGRGLRPYPGKKDTIILDHAGNTLKHGFPDDDREWSLEGQPKKKKDIEDDEGRNRLKVRQCPSCYRVHRYADSCPSCGHIYVRGAREVEERDGELRQIDPEARKAIMAARKAMVEECRTLKDFQDVARRLGYKSGWAWYEWNKRKGRSA